MGEDTKRGEPVALQHFGFLSVSRGAVEAPVRSVLFGRARFEQHGQSLATTHEVREDGGAAGRFFPRLEENVAVLRATRALLEQRTEEGIDVGPAAHWLLENGAVIDEQLHAIRKGLPRSFFRKLPVLRDEPLAGLPRIYGVAWAWVAHSDAALNACLLEAYLTAYQAQRELTLAELWAFPTTLRVVLVENLRRLAERASTEQLARDAAHHWFDGPPEARRIAALDTLEEVMRVRGVVDAFLLQLDQRDEELPLEEAVPLSAWICARLPDPASALTRQQSSATEDQQSIRNTLTTLRMLDRFNWEEIFTASCRTTRTLSNSPVFAGESEDTKQATLHAIERLARRARMSESGVAQHVLALTSTGEADAPQAAPGYWLSGAGRHTLYEALDLPQHGLRILEVPARRLVYAWIYLVGLLAGSIAMVAWVMDHVALAGAPSWLLGLTAILLFVPVSEALVALVNRLISESLRPPRLPRKALLDGIPHGSGALVVIPGMITSADSVESLCRQLEQHYLANPERNAQFALLSDWADADLAHCAGDEALLRMARDGIERLNRTHPVAVGQGGHLRFLLLQRNRVWSKTEARYIGWERKRGKIEQLVRHLAERGESPFIHLGLPSSLQHDLRYLVVLDSDTDMPPGRLRELVGIASHPLNRARVDPALRRVVAGYGIIQPRVVTPLPTPDTVSWYHLLFNGECGIDPYSAASSEIYQDLFGQGSFSGKGLIDIGAMHAVLDRRLPEGQVLSHDLLEGALLRCAAVSDVSFIEAAPLHPDVAASRLHRWTRGDWQLLPFLLCSRRWGLSLISAWKMLDNLRRSLVTPASLMLIVIATASGVVPVVWALGVVAAAFCAGPLMGAVAGFAPSRDDLSLGLFYRNALKNLVRAFLLAVWQIVELLQLAMTYSDAIGRAMYRQLFSRRYLLQWTTALAAQAAASVELSRLWRMHWRVPFVAAILLAGFGVADMAGLPVSWPAAVCLCLCWGLTAVWTWLASRARPRYRRARIDDGDRGYLLNLARDTWRYYERHVIAAENHLPPDNVQMLPYRMVARRTSPTNIGLYLSALAVARKLGFVGRVDMARRIALTLDTLDRLPRHAGHFYNWYDTATLAVLQPAYVSTVDSGNCSGHLLLLARACEDAASEAVDDPANQRALQLAICAGEVRLRALRPMLSASPALQTLSILSMRDVKWPAAPEDAARLDELVRRARIEFDGEFTARLLDEESGSISALNDYLVTLESALLDLSADLAELRERLLRLAARARRLALEPDYAMLYDRQRHLLHIGLRVDNDQLDTNHYDLLASEARLTSLIAIAKGDIPARHWGALGRPFFSRGRIVGLKSWSGSMFEYLMPSLLLDEPIGSVLQQVIRSAVDEQQRDAARHGTPWGISESAIAAQDHTLAYQYGPQGVARLALRRTPQDERVIAPYASAMALVVAPCEAIANLRRLEALGVRKDLGFIESLDYSPIRVAVGQHFTPVYTFMAHHQAMSLLAIADVLTDGEARRLAMSDPWLRAVGALLHERAPTQVPELEERVEIPPPRRQRNTYLVMNADPKAEALQATQLLGNGRYTVLLRANGAGLSRWGKFNVTRWRDDALRDVHGTFLYLQRSGAVRPVSLTAHPAPDPAASYQCRIQTDRVIHDALWDDLSARSTVWVSPEDDCEMRQVELANSGDTTLELVLSLYAEVSLAPQAADEAHPAFSNLFIQSSWHAAENALYLRRQPRLAGESTVQGVYFLASAAGEIQSIEVCTDRARWMGRYGSVQRVAGPGGAIPFPAGSGDGQDPLPGVAMDTGLDPVAVISVRLRLAPRATARLTFCAAAAEETSTLAELVDKYRQGAHVQRASSMSHTMGSIRLRELHYDADTWQATLYLQTLVSSQITRDLALSRAALQAGPGGAVRCDKRSLWRHGISGDKPIVLLTTSNELGLGLAQTLKRVLRGFNDAGVAVDLVVLNAEPASYLTPVQNQLQIMRDRFAMQISDRGVPELKPGFHILRERDLGAEEHATLTMLARVRLVADGRSLAIQMERLVDEFSRDATRRRDSRLWLAGGVLPALALSGPTDAPEGYFDAGSSHFHFAIDPQRQPSRPWVQVLANPDFGCQISEVGGGYTWAGNSRMHQITEWSNDPLTDPASEHLLLHDLDSGAVHRLGRTLGTHGQRDIEYGAGMARMRQRIDELDVELVWCVDTERAVKQVQVSITDRRGRARRLRLVAMAEWFMGSARRERISILTRMQPLVVGLEGAGLPLPATATLLSATQTDASAGFGESTAFLLLRTEGGHSAAKGRVLDDWTCDRREFFDTAGRLVLPSRLAMRSGAGLDACAAIACVLTPSEGRTVHATVLLGHGVSPAAAELLALEAWQIEPEARFAAGQAYWQTHFASTQVSTPDPAFDALVNHWLPYQTLACRMWARTGFYQAGGAFGYRDQLQDAMAFVSREPAILARQIRVNAARQFPEGDVQHWWHQPGGAGVRTHFSDDRLWLPLALALHVERNGDFALLDEMLPFLEGARVPEGAEDIYEAPRVSEISASLYEHAARAIDCSLNSGAHGLPLFGTGDWNDGMNRVGHEGRGESVWLAWFLCVVIDAMLPLARRQGDNVRAATWQAARRGWLEALEDQGWDGNWYRRGFFDDGSALGSAANPECRIDLIAQAWAVLSGAARPERAQMAMDSAWRQLFDPEAHLLRLLDPPLQHAQPSAGYIQAYPAGVRENGGQYNHAAVWGLMAFARMGDADRAWQVFTSLSPAHRWQDPALASTYAIEPYVMAGDIYSQAPRAGRGGWSWYTGSAGWLMRAGVESICGVVCHADAIIIEPCLPPHWDKAEVRLSQAGHQLHIVVCASELIAGAVFDAAPRALRVVAGQRVVLDGLAERVTLVVATYAPELAEHALPMEQGLQAEPR